MKGRQKANPQARERREASGVSGAEGQNKRGRPRKTDPTLRADFAARGLHSDEKDPAAVAAYMFGRDTVQLAFAHHLLCSGHRVPDCEAIWKYTPLGNVDNVRPENRSYDLPFPPGGFLTISGWPTIGGVVEVLLYRLLRASQAVPRHLYVPMLAKLQQFRKHWAMIGIRDDARSDRLQASGIVDEDLRERRRVCKDALNFLRIKGEEAFGQTSRLRPWYLLGKQIGLCRTVLEMRIHYTKGFETIFELATHLSTSDADYVSFITALKRAAVENKGQDYIAIIRHALADYRDSGPWVTLTNCSFDRIQYIAGEAGGRIDGAISREVWALGRHEQPDDSIEGLIWMLAKIDELFLAGLEQIPAGSSASLFPDVPRVLLTHKQVAALLDLKSYELTRKRLDLHLPSIRIGKNRFYDGGRVAQLALKWKERKKKQHDDAGMTDSKASFDHAKKRGENF